MPKPENDELLLRVTPVAGCQEQPTALSPLAITMIRPHVRQELRHTAACERLFCAEVERLVSTGELARGEQGTTWSEDAHAVYPHCHDAACIRPIAIWSEILLVNTVGADSAVLVARDPVELQQKWEERLRRVASCVAVVDAAQGGAASERVITPGSTATSPDRSRT